MISLSEFAHLLIEPVKLHPYQRESLRRIERGDRLVPARCGWRWAQAQESVTMNTDTGKLYEDANAIRAARLRGEPLAVLGPEAARVVRAGQAALRHERQRARRKAKRRMVAGSKRRNR